MALHIGYGLVTAQRPDHSDQPWPEVYADVLALVEQAEQCGFDSAWTSEHHFTADGYMSALLPVTAALAARTRRLLLGTNVLLAPLHHPLRIAEDAAAVDAISDGRLRLGLAIGYRDEEFAAFGVPKRERVARLEETVAVCRKAWTGESFSHHGPSVQVDGLRSRPPATGAEIWLGGWVDPAVRRAGRLADGYISPVGDLADTRRRVGLLDEARADGLPSLPTPAGIATATFVVVTEDGSVPESARAGLAHMMATYGDWYGSSSDDGGGRQVAQMIELMKTGGDLPAGVVAGTPEAVVDQLLPLATAFGHEREHHLVVRLHYPGMGRAEAADHLARFAEAVLPHLRN